MVPLQRIQTPSQSIPNNILENRFLTFSWMALAFSMWLLSFIQSNQPSQWQTWISTKMPYITWRKMLVHYQRKIIYKYENLLAACSLKQPYINVSMAILIQHLLFPEIWTCVWNSFYQQIENIFNCLNIFNLAACSFEIPSRLRNWIILFFQNYP